MFPPSWPITKMSSTLYVGVVNDREYGGVFYSHDAGQHWLQKAAGLGGKDVFALKQAPSGMLVAGTNHGVYFLERNGSEWHPMNVVAAEPTVKAPRQGSRQAGATTTFEKSELEARVNDLELGSERWLAATTSGIYWSTDQGKTWKGAQVLGQTDFVSVRAEGSTVVAATRSSVLVSNDSGATWKLAGLPSYVVSIRSAAIASDSRQIMIAAREGGFRSGDGGSDLGARRQRPARQGHHIRQLRSHPPAAAGHQRRDGRDLRKPRRRTFLAARSRQRISAAPGRRNRRTFRGRDSVRRRHPATGKRIHQRRRRSWQRRVKRNSNRNHQPGTRKRFPGFCLLWTALTLFESGSPKRPCLRSWRGWETILLALLCDLPVDSRLRWS